MASNKIGLTDYWIVDEESNGILAESYMRAASNPGLISSAELSEVALPFLEFFDAPKNYCYFYRNPSPRILWSSAEFIVEPLQVFVSDSSSLSLIFEPSEIPVFVGPLGKARTHRERAAIFRKNFDPLEEDEGIYLDLPEDLL